jgi:glyoxylase-like metal-dependent hydrolase (beta-lactamase superfamily II)
VSSLNGKDHLIAGFLHYLQEAALETISPAPLKFVINTHYHWDHTDGNPWMHEASATIVAHENTLERVTSGTRVIIPGHGPVGDRAQRTGFRDMLVTVRDNVAQLKKQGKTLAETIAARPTAAFDAQYGDFVIGPAFFIQLVYMGV